MTLDIRTMALISTLVAVLTAGVMLVISRTNYQDKSTQVWALGNCLIAVGFLLIVFRGVLPDFFSIPVANSSIIVGQFLLLAGSIRFYRRTLPHKIIVVSVLIFFGLFVYLTYVHPSVSLRIVLISLFDAVICYWTAWVLYEAGKEEGPPSYLTVVVFVLFGTFMLYRSGMTLLQGSSENFMSAALLHGMAFASFIVAGIGWTFGFSVMINARLLTTLNKRARELEAANNAKSRFLSNMSHELRTPLHSIIGFGQLLKMDVGSTWDSSMSQEQQQRAVHHILKGGEHLLMLIEQVLDLSKIESGTLSLSIEVVELEPLVEDCFAVISIMAKKKRLSLQTNLLGREERFPPLMADRMRLRQILLNLLSNATKYNVEGGSIVLSGELASSGMFRISVVDTGHGIPAEFHSRVFTPFHRLAEEGSGTDGTGIGLAITSELVNRMGGKIGFASTEGEGATFWFELPVADGLVGEVDARKQVFSSERVRIPSCSVLYIEDNPANLELMELILADVEGLVLHTAHTAELGLESAITIHPDLILMDINLPGMNGLQALKVLRDEPITRNIPIIAVSANALAVDIQRAKEAGFDQYITKPFDIREVLFSISDLLNRKTLPEQGGDPNVTNHPCSPGSYAFLDGDCIEKLFVAANALPGKYITVLTHQANAIPEQIGRLRSLDSCGESKELERVAHTLKTNCRTFGAELLGSHAQELEHFVRGGDDRIAEYVSIIEREYEQVSASIQQLLRDLKECSENTGPNTRKVTTD